MTQHVYYFLSTIDNYKLQTSWSPHHSRQLKNLSSHNFNMSFGSQAYQHRFYSQVPNKKQPIYSPTRQATPIDNGVQYNQRPNYQYHFSPNDINLKARAGPLAKNSLGWQGYRMKSYVTNLYSQDYNYHAEMLERFKKESEQYKKKKRYAVNYSSDYSRINDQPVLPVIKRVHTSPQQQTFHQQYSYNEAKQNPETSRISKFDVGIMARIDEPNRNRVISRQQAQKQKTTLDQLRLKLYRDKYSKLKRRLKRFIAHKHDQSIEQNGQQEQEGEKQKMRELTKIMSDISVQITKNTSILNESIKIQQPTPEISSKKSQLTTNNQQETIHQNINDKICSPVIHHLPSPLSPPSVVYRYHLSGLNSQYAKLQQLNQQIRQLSKRNS